MRAKSILLTASLAASLALSQSAMADADADAKAAFTARYAQLRTAFESRDPKAIKALLAPKFQSFDVRGEASDADEMIDDLGRFPPNADRKTEMTIKSVATKGDTAVVEQTRDIKLSHPGPDSAAHAMEIVSTSDDSWVQSPSGWLLASTATIDMTIMRDGVVMRHMSKGDGQ